MTDLKESIVDSIKGFLLPELRKLQDGIKGLGTRMDAVEKQMVIMNENISNNSRRIDKMGERIDEMGARLDSRIDEMGARLDGRIDEMGARLDGRIDEIGTRLEGRIDEMGARLDGRIDEMNTRLGERIDNIHVEFVKVGIEMERLKREDAITADILHRMGIIEEKVLLGK